MRTKSPKGQIVRCVNYREIEKKKQQHNLYMPVCSFSVFTDTTNPEFLIGSFAIHKQLGIGHEWSQGEPSRAQTELRYSYRFICKDNYYGDTCSKICAPRDDHFGHYTCKTDGQIACLSGWKGEYCQERKQE